MTTMTADHLDCRKPSQHKQRNFLLRASDNLSKTIEQLCGRWGLFVARNAFFVTFASITLAGLFGCGLMKLNVVYRPYDLWVPKDSEFVKATNWIASNFPPQYRKQVAIWQSDNILTAASIQTMWKAHQSAQQIAVPFKGKTYRWTDVCLPFPLEYSSSPKSICYETSLLELWGFNQTIIDDLTDDLVVDAINNIRVSIPYGGALRDYSSYLGGVETDNDGKVVRASAALYTWFTVVDVAAIDRGDFEMDVSSGEKVDKGGIAWERGLVEQIDQLNGNGTSINLRAGYTLSDVLMTSIMEDAKWIGIGWAFLILYLLITLGKPFERETRIFPAIVGLSAIAMAIISSFGLCSYFDIPYGTLNNVLPVLLVALGVDDMYVIVTAWDAVKSPFKEDLNKRAQLTMQRAGVAVTVTSTTNILAFVVGTQTRLPGLRWFCIYSATGVLFVYLLQITFFVAAMVINQRWQDAKDNKLSTTRQYEPKTSSGGTCKLLQGWGKVLSYTWAKIFVIVFTIVLFVGSSFNILNMSKEFDTMWLLPKSSSLYHWYESIEELFPDAGENGFIYFKEFDFPGDLPALNDLAHNISTSPYVSKVDAWFQGIDLYSQYPFISFLDQKSQCLTVIRDIDLKYLSHFKIDLRADDFFGDDEPCSSFLMEFQYKTLTSETMRQDAMQQVRQLIKDSKVSGHNAAWAHAFSYWETEKIIISELVQSLSMVMCVVFLISLVLLGSLRASLLVLACVVGTLVNVASCVHMWGLTINTITSIAFVLGVGICVDYSAHIAHDFLKVQGTRNERASQALHHIGSAVLHGGVSTLIAFLLLSPSGSYIFVSYFKILTCVSIFGLYHALVFLPVLLSLFGPDPHPDTDNSREKYDFKPASSIFVEKIPHADIRKSTSIYTINAHNPPRLELQPDKNMQRILATHRRSTSLPSYRIFPAEIPRRNAIDEKYHTKL